MGGVNVGVTIAWIGTYAVIVWCNKNWMGDLWRRWFQ